MPAAYQTAIKAIERARQPVLMVPEGGGADGLASAFGIARLLQKLEKPVAIISADAHSAETLTFLNTHGHPVRPSFDRIRSFAIRLDMRRTRANELSYDVVGDELQIFLTPASGTWTERDISISASDYRYDLIIAVGAATLESYAHLFRDHPDFFYRTPIINIDHAPHNEHFGHYNIVDVTASACGEVCHDWVHTVAPELLDDTMATQFLAGMIAKTKSFRSPQVTPKTLQVASALMARGARRDEIVHHLFRTRSIETLRLWGRALARLKSDAERGIVWSLLSQQDFLHAGTTDAALAGVADELISSSPDAKIAVLFYEDRDKQTCAIVHATRPHDAIVLTTPFKPSGTHEEVRLRFSDKNLVEAEQVLLTHLRQITK